MGSRYIAIDGPIGVGKSSLATMLAEHLGGNVVSEPVDDNPFLPQFYADRRKYAFQTQMYFLLARYGQQQELAQRDLFHAATVADYTFAKDRIFATLTLSPDELSLYDKLYDLLRPRVVLPDLVVFLQARTDVLQSRIKKRARDYEKRIDLKYLENLSTAYSSYFFHYTETPLLVVNTSDIDFVHNREDFEQLAALVEQTKKGTHHYQPLGRSH